MNSINDVGSNIVSSPTMFFIKSDYKIIRVEIAKIIFIEGMREYVRIYTGNKPYVTNISLTQMESYLPIDIFFRVHRSYIINIEQIDYIKGNEIIAGNFKIPISKKRKDAFCMKINSANFF